MVERSGPRCMKLAYRRQHSKCSPLQFRVIPKAELAEGIDSATSFTSVCINTAIYLPYLVSQCLTAGVSFKRAVFNHICDAVTSHSSGQKAQIVVNCTGLSAAKIGGVEDKTVIPARGQIVLVRNDPGAMYNISGCDDGEDEASYIMMRAAAGGSVLGGSYQKGNWDPQPDPNLAMRIMRRAVNLCPQLTSGAGVEGLDIIRHSVGLRPLRAAGARIEKEKINGVWVIHNYGHGGYGYQSSYGCSQEVVQLADELLATEIQDERARL
jgi:D-amino-acid oxidase